jgi:hypothetical protein
MTSAHDRALRQAQENHRRALARRLASATVLPSALSDLALPQERAGAGGARAPSGDRRAEPARISSAPPTPRCLTPEQGREFLARQGRTRRKFGNQPSVVDGQRFDSRREAETYRQLKLRREAGEVKWFLRQTRFDLPGGVIYRADFLVYFGGERGVEIWDSKGHASATYKIKRRQVEAIYGVEILEV